MSVLFVKLCFVSISVGQDVRYPFLGFSIKEDFGRTSSSPVCGVTEVTERRKEMKS